MLGVLPLHDCAKKQMDGREHDLMTGGAKVEQKRGVRTSRPGRPSMMSRDVKEQETSQADDATRCWRMCKSSHSVTLPACN
jgi:hypothetical protein